MLIIISGVFVPTSTVMGYGGYEIFVKDSKNICIYIWCFAYKAIEKYAEK